MSVSQCTTEMHTAKIESPWHTFNFFVKMHCRGGRTTIISLAFSSSYSTDKLLHAHLWPQRNSIMVYNNYYHMTELVMMMRPLTQSPVGPRGGTTSACHPHTHSTLYWTLTPKECACKTFPFTRGCRTSSAWDPDSQATPFSLIGRGREKRDWWLWLQFPLYSFYLYKNLGTQDG